MIMNKRSGWFKPSKVTRRRTGLLRSLDLALTDPPSLCCDDDELCPACRAESVLCRSH